MGGGRGGGTQGNLIGGETRNLIIKCFAFRIYYKSLTGPYGNWMSSMSLMEWSGWEKWSETAEG